MKFFAIIEKNKAIAVVVSRSEFLARKRIAKTYPQATLVDINKISDDAYENDILVIDKQKLTLYSRCKLALLNIKISSEPVRLDDENDPIHEGRQIIRMMDQSMKTGLLKIFQPWIKKNEIIALINKAIEITNSDKTWSEKYEEITYLRISEFINDNGYSFIWNKPKEDSLCFQVTSYVNQLISFKIKMNWTKNDKGI